MITSIILTVIYYALYAVMSVTVLLLPDVTANSTITSTIVSLNNYIAFFNTMLPMDTVWAILTIIVGVEVILATYKLVMWVIRRFPTQS